MEEHFEVLSAMLDGCTVDIHQLETAIDDPRGRRALVDFVRFRQELRSEAPSPDVAWLERVKVKEVAPHRPTTRRAFAAVAAAAVIAALATASFGGYLSRWTERESPPVPKVTRVFALDPVEEAR